MSKYFKLDKDKREVVLDKTKRYNVNIDILDLILDLKLEIERLNYIIDKQDRDITSLTKSKLILKERYNKAIEFIKENENNISSIKDLENNKTYNSALLGVKDILQGVDKE